MNTFLKAVDQEYQNNSGDTPNYKSTIPGLEYTIEFPVIQLETIDFAIKKWFEYDNPLYILGKEDVPEKVGAVFSTTERWAMVNLHADKRNQYGTLNLPLISIKREDVQIIPERTVAVDNQGTSNITLYVRQYVNPISGEKEYISDYSDKHDRKNIVEIIEILPPKFCKINYSIAFWSNYIEDLNPMIQHMIEKFGNKHAIYASPTMFFSAFLENVSNQSNDEDISSTEMVFKNTFNITVEAPITSVDDIRTRRAYQGVTTDFFSDEQSLTKYQSAKIMDKIDWHTPYKLYK